MKVGDYVRYVKWKYKENSQDVRIAKIKDIQEETGYKQKFIFFENGNGEYEDYIIKSSPNIIDLIEVGDYVNGWRVNRVEKEEDGILLTIGTITSFISKNETEPYLTQDYDEVDKMCKLKSIVTKEQFENMEYKL